MAEKTSTIDPVANNPFKNGAARTDDEAYEYFLKLTDPNPSQLWSHNYSVLSDQKFPDRQHAVEEVWRHPGPGTDYPGGVHSGQVSVLPTFGPIVTYINPNSGTTFNLTLPGHRLYPGFVMRFPVENSANSWQIVTVGRGSGWPGALSGLGAEYVWNGRFF